MLVSKVFKLLEMVLAYSSSLMPTQKMKVALKKWNSFLSVKISMRYTSHVVHVLPVLQQQLRHQPQRLRDTQPVLRGQTRYVSLHYTQQSIRIYHYLFLNSVWTLINRKRSNSLTLLKLLGASIMLHWRSQILNYKDFKITKGTSI